MRPLPDAGLFAGPRALMRSAARVAEVCALAFAAVFAFAAPLPRLDDFARGGLLRALAPTTPPPDLFHLSVTTADLREGQCGEQLAKVLRDGEARGALLWSWAAEVCAPPAAVDPPSSVPVVGMPRSAFRFASGGRPYGWTPDEALVKATGAGAWTWVLAPRRDSVPGARLADLVVGRVAPSVLAKRVVVLSVDADERAAAEGADVAAVVGAVMNNGGRPVAPRIAGGALGLLAGGALVLAHRKRRGRGLIVAAALAIALLFSVFAALFRLAGGALVPFGSLAVAIVAAAAILNVPAAAARRQSSLRARELLGRASRDRRRPPTYAEDEEFFAGVATAARGLHPCDVALVADLVPGTSTLRFWGPKGEAESLVVGPKDFRQMPFCDESGVPSVRVVRELLAMPNMPAVVAPLGSAGVTEGCLVLCGEGVVRAHLDDGDRTARVAREVASWLRVRRLTAERHDEAPEARAASAASTERTLLDQTRALVEDADILERALRESPVAVLQADATGSVRFIGHAMRHALEAANVSLPHTASDGPVSAGTLSIEAAIAALTEADPAAVAAAMSDAMDQIDGVLLPVTKGPARHSLEIRAIRREVDQVSVVVAWLATLLGTHSQPAAEAEAGVAAGAAVTQLRLEHEFVVHDAWEATSAAIDAAISVAGAPIRLSSGRMSAFVIAQRTNVFPALMRFLVDAAKLAPADQPPAVSLRERGRTVEIALMDLHLGLSRAAIQRVLDAAGSAPKELKSLGKLVWAIEQSQGTTRLRGEGGWGAQIVLALPRARAPGQIANASVPPAISIESAKGPRTRK